MYKRFILFILIVTLMAAVLATIQLQTGQVKFASIVSTEIVADYQAQILLVPLDSRPPCTQFVEQLAAIGRTSVHMPPQELLGKYRIPGDKHAIREWFRQKSQTMDTAIVSIDMLIHGGLWTSRLQAAQHDDIQAVMELLKHAKRNNPNLKLYAFSIIPRLIIADTEENAAHQKNMLKYSVEKDLLLTFENPFNYQKLIDFEAKLPPEIIERYQNLYEQNKRLNYMLTELVKDGTIDGLVIGQDDGHYFGLPNMVKSAVEHYVEQSGLRHKIVVTRGTDEVALTILGHIITKNTSYTPRIYVRYSHKDAPAIVMPFMPHSVNTTVNEKIRMVNGIRVDAPEQADFILYVHIGTRFLSGYTYDNAAREIKAMINAGQRVAVVDLTEDYYASETIFPWMLKHEVPLMRLSAYAGWNTTSNSIGTAVTQLAISGSSPTAALSAGQALFVWKAHTKFLLSRFFDDWYFQKEIQPFVDTNLKAAGINPHSLGDAYPATKKLVQKIVNDKSQYWYIRHLRYKPETIETREQPLQVMVSAFSVETDLPWQRTFEVYLQPHLTVVEIK